MKKIFLRGAVVLIVISMFVVSAFAVSAFPDVDEDAEYAEAVSYVSEVGIMVGDENGNFNPDKTVTRAEMAVILCNMLGEAENLTTDGSIFTDVPAEHWANPYVVKTAELGLVTGYGDGRFGPADDVTYEQAVTMVVSAVGGEVEAQENGGYPNGFIDVADDNGILEGVVEKIGAPMTRKSVAFMIVNCMD